MDFNFVFLSNYIYEDLVKRMAGERLGTQSFIIILKKFDVN